MLTGTLLHSGLSDSQLVQFRVQEGMSHLFAVEVEFQSEDANLDLDALCWSEALIALEDGDSGGSRSFHGIVEEAEYLFMRASLHRYRLLLRPYIHGLAYRVRSRIFQGLDAVAIVKKIAQESGMPPAAFDWSRLAGPYPAREFCMQYKESELAFVLRLLEDEGIFFWFEHSDAGHVMHFGESSDAYAAIDGTPNISAHGRTPSLHLAGELLHELRFSTRLTHEIVHERDWNWQQPRNPVEGKAEGDKDTGLTAYEYPGGFRSPQEGGAIAQTRLEEARLEKFMLEGESTAYRLVPGRTFTVDEATPAYVNGPYLITSVDHDFFQHVAGAEGGEANQRPGYRCSFRAIPSSVEYRPRRVTPKPRIFGKESAVVTGPEEIHVDESGRIKVHFYFDREGAVDENASCWLRVQQQNTSGSMLLPRRGWEVSVGFINGDPDRPIVLQKLYNGETMPPYGLPANKTQGALQSSTTPGGGSTNEIRMQDGNGGMEFAIHSSKDFKMTAGADLMEDIAVDAHEEIGALMTRAVTANETVTVGAKQSVSVTGDSTNTTNGSKTITIGAVDDLGVTGNVGSTCNGARTESIAGMMNVLANSVSETFNGSCTRSVGAAQSIASATVIIDAVGAAKTELVGAAKLEICGKAKAESISGSKTLISGFMTEKTGADIGYSSKGAVAFNVGGAIAEKCGGDFSCSAKVILITAPGGINIKGGGTPYTLKGANIEIDAGSMAIDGGMAIKLSGKVNYKP